MASAFRCTYVASALSWIVLWEMMHRVLEVAGLEQNGGDQRGLCAKGLDAILLEGLVDVGSGGGGSGAFFREFGTSA